MTISSLTRQLYTFEDIAPSPTGKNDIMSLAQSSVFDVDIQTELNTTIQKDSETADTLIEIGGTLVGMHQDLSQGLERGDVSIAGAGALNVVIESLQYFLGENKRPVFALESLGGKTARKQAIAMAMESISEMIAAVIRKIVAFIKSAYAYIATDIKTAIAGADAIKAKAARILGLAVRKQSAEVKLLVPTITTRKLREFFHLKGTALTPQQIQDGYSKYNKEINESFYEHAMHNTLAHIALSVQNEIKKNGSSGMSEATAVSLSDAAIKYFTNHALVHFTEVVGKDNTTRSYALPFQNSKIYAVFGSSDGKHNTISVSIVADECDAPKKIMVLTPNEVVVLARLVESEMSNGIYKDHHKILKAISESGAAVVAVCDMVGKIPSPDTGTLPALQFLKTINASIASLTKLIYGYSGRCNMTLLDYCEASMREWK